MHILKYGNSFFSLECIDFNPSEISGVYALLPAIVNFPLPILFNAPVLTK